MIDLARVQPVLPKYDRGELPVDYLPLSGHTLRSNEVFGALPFTVTPTSHRHHLDHMNLCARRPLHGSDEDLYPFEFWSMVRVMSRWKFGRLNELISIGAERLVLSRPNVGEELIGSASVQSIKTQGGVCFGFFQSTTTSESGELYMKARDVLLLINGSDANALRRAVSLASENKIMTTINSSGSVLAQWTLEMRFPWPDELWRNNVHTQNYAVSLGYKGALVEGPPIADVVWHVDKPYRTHRGSCNLSWKYLAPLCLGTRVVLIRKVLDANVRRYYICEEPREYPANCRVLLDMEVRGL